MRSDETISHSLEKVAIQREGKHPARNGWALDLVGWSHTDVDYDSPVMQWGS